MSVPLLCCYTGISEVQSFSIDRWSSDKQRSSDYFLRSQKLKILNSLWLSSKYRLQGVFRQLKPDSLDVGKNVHTFWPEAIALFWPTCKSDAAVLDSCMFLGKECCCWIKESGLVETDIESLHTLSEELGQYSQGVSPSHSSWHSSVSSWLAPFRGLVFIIYFLFVLATCLLCFHLDQIPEVSVAVN